MHEASLMSQTLAMAQSRAMEAGAVRIVSLRLGVGVLSGVVSDSLQFAFEAMRVGTMAADARLDIETVPVACQCESCGAEYKPEGSPGKCLICGVHAGRVIKGYDLLMLKLEVE